VASLRAIANLVRGERIDRWEPRRSTADVTRIRPLAGAPVAADPEPDQPSQVAIA
jgi:hypothetical protein